MDDIQPWSWTSQEMIRVYVVAGSASALLIVANLSACWFLSYKIGRLERLAEVQLHEARMRQSRGNMPKESTLELQEFPNWPTPVAPPPRNTTGAYLNMAQQQQRTQFVHNPTTTYGQRQ